VLAVVRALTQELLILSNRRKKLDLVLSQRRPAQSGQRVDRFRFEKGSRCLEDARNGRDRPAAHDAPLGAAAMFEAKDVQRHDQIRGDLKEDGSESWEDGLANRTAS